MQHVNGFSSLLFIISTIKALVASNLLAWKVFNATLIVASYLCNASGFQPDYLFYDYLNIFLVCISYINNIYINIPFIISLIYEYNKYNSIENTKNISFVSAVTKSVIYTYLYVDKFHYYIILSSSLCGITIYKIRLILFQNNNRKYNNMLTYLFHICIMNIMYISSITAVYTDKHITNIQ